MKQIILIILGFLFVLSGVFQQNEIDMAASLIIANMYCIASFLVKE